ncbi:MAG: hypothetical protein PHO07_16370 [Pirellulales bacterium]|nr:hypothetical protein [Pirellulales bacterium]
MKGTRIPQTRAMLRMPPRITRPVRTIRTTPETHWGTFKVCLSRTEMELAWTMLPMPKAAIAVNRAKTMPSHLQFSPRSSTYIGPPAISPLLLTVRYFTARTASPYLVAMPNTPVSHIHNTAPGPPAATAVATPTMLPVPIVAARAVIRAPK